MGSDPILNCIACPVSEVPHFLRGGPGVVLWHDAHHHLSEVLHRATPMTRLVVEGDSRFRQIAVYCVLVRPATSGSLQVFTYRRQGGEPRLQGSLSVGIGGHVEPCDFPLVPFSRRSVPLRLAGVHAAALREIEEEVQIPPGSCLEFSCEAVIVSNETSVERCHLGLLYFLHLAPHTSVALCDPSLAGGSWNDLSALVEPTALSGFEFWGQHTLRLLDHRYAACAALR